MTNVIITKLWMAEIFVTGILLVYNITRLGFVAALVKPYFINFYLLSQAGYDTPSLSLYIKCYAQTPFEFYY